MKHWSSTAIIIATITALLGGIIAGRLYEHSVKLAERQAAAEVVAVVGEIATKNKELYELAEEKSNALLEGAACAYQGRRDCYEDNLATASALAGRQSALYDEVNSLIDRLNGMLGPVEGSQEN